MPLKGGKIEYFQRGGLLNSILLLSSSIKYVVLIEV